MSGRSLPSGMSAGEHTLNRMSLLIPVIFPHEDALVDPNVQGLTGFDIVLFGYWSTPAGVDPTVVCRDHTVEAEAEQATVALIESCPGV